MNKERILELANLIEQQEPRTNHTPTGFSMSIPFHACRTPSCIAGWACHLYGDDMTSDPLYVATGLLDLEGMLADELFAPDNDYAAYFAIRRAHNHVTPQHAAAVLRHLAATGEVDWSVKSFPKESETVENPDHFTQTEPQPIPENNSWDEIERITGWRPSALTGA